VRAVGDEGEPEMLAEGEYAVEDVVVAGQMGKTTVAEVGEHGEACIDGCAQLIKRGIGVAGGDDDVAAGEHAGDVQSGVLFGSQRDKAREAAGSVEQALHGGFTGLADGVDWMGAAISIDGAEERTLNVNAVQDLAESGDGFAERDEGAEAGLHGRERVRDDSGEDSFNTLRGELGAGGADAGGLEIVTVEVDAGVAVDLKIEVGHRVT